MHEHTQASMLLGLNDPNLYQPASAMAKKLLSQNLITSSDQNEKDHTYQCTMRVTLADCDIKDINNECGYISQADAEKVMKHLNAEYKWDKVNDWHTQYDIKFPDDSDDIDIIRGRCMADTGLVTTAIKACLSMRTSFQTLVNFSSLVDTSYEKLFLNQARHTPNQQSTPNSKYRSRIRACESATVRICKEYVLKSSGVEDLSYVYRISEGCDGDTLQNAEQSMLVGKSSFRFDITITVDSAMLTYENLSYYYLSLLLKLQDILATFSADKSMYIKHDVHSS